MLGFASLNPTYNYILSLYPLLPIPYSLSPIPYSLVTNVKTWESYKR
jgi:hypothetical protein